MPTEEKIIAAGFNAGYLMQAHEPELLNQILKSNNQDSQYLSAMTTGKDTQEQQKEKAKENIVKQQQEIRKKQQEKKRGR